MIRILQGHSLTPRDRFQPERMSLQLTERNSTATLTLSESMPALQVDDWLQAEDGPAAGIVWRVKTVENQVETKTRSVTLEHAIMTLKDTLIFGDTPYSAISGNKNVNPTAQQTVNYILNKQSHWALAGIDRNPSNPYSFNGEDLYAALESVSSSLTECLWEYDFSRYPFRLYMRSYDDSVHSEMRTDRNIKTMRKTIDRSRMYTRFYPVGENDLHIAGDYVSQNENLYGIVSKTETDQSKKTENELRQWALQRLDRHCEPSVTVTISGLDLSEATGEPLDSFRIGQMCRVPLPEFSTTIIERITKLSYSDVINEPMTVTITLANEVPDVATIMKQENASTSKASRTSAKKNADDHAWMVDTEDHVGLVAEAVAGPGADKDWSRVAEVFVDGQGIHQRVTYTENEIVAAWSAIEATESKIYLEVANAKSDTYAKIEETASYIRTEVNASKSTIYSTIMQTATNIYTQVGNAKSDTFAKIEQTASSIRSEVNSSKSTIYSTIMQTATNIYTQVGNTKSDMYSAIEQSASGIRQDVWAAKSTLFSTIMQTATNIYTQVGNTKSDMYSAIEQSASGIRQDVWAAKSTMYSTIMQTATNIYTQVGNAKSDTYSKIEQTARSITSEVYASKSDFYSRIEQTESSITTEVGSAKSDLYSSIQQTESSIITQVGSAKSSLYSYIEQTASNITISASRVMLTSNKNLGSILGIDGNGYAYFIGQVAFFDSSQSASSMINLNGGKVDAPTLQVANGGHLKFAKTGGNVVDIQYADIATTVKSVEMDPNDASTLIFTRYDGTTLSFSKATSVQATWNSGGQYVSAVAYQNGTAVASDSFYIGYRFAEYPNSGGHGTHKALELYRQTGPSSSVALTNTQNTVVIGLSGRTARVQNLAGVAYPNTPELDLSLFLHTPPTITVNGTYSVPSGYIGFDEFEVDVPDPYNLDAYMNHAAVYITSMDVPQYYGKLYRRQGSTYVEAASQDCYWYWSTKDIGSRTVHY